MVSQKKIETRKKLEEIFKSYKSILIFDLKKFPSKQLHNIRNELKENEIYTIVSKKEVIRFALKNCNINFPIDVDIPAVIYSNKDIFEIKKILDNIKAKRKAKVGEIAIADIELQPGDTGMMAGPAISIFKKFGIQTMIKDGKISIKEPKVVCKEGEEISMDLVSLLNSLNIEPLEVSIAPVIGYYDGLVYSKDILNLDENYFIDGISKIANNLFKITVSINYPTNQNISFLIQKAETNANSLALKLGIPYNREIAESLIVLSSTHAKKFNL